MLKLCYKYRRNIIAVTKVKRFTESHSALRKICLIFLVVVNYRPGIEHIIAVVREVIV